jgi:hypothetical protein
MVLFDHWIMVSEVILYQKFFWFGAKIRRDRLNYMSIGVFSIYGNVPYSWRIFQIRLSSLRVFPMHAKILLAYSETTFCTSKTTLKSAQSLCTLKELIEQHEKKL